MTTHIFIIQLRAHNRQLRRRVSTQVYLATFCCATNVEGQKLDVCHGHYSDFSGTPCIRVDVCLFVHCVTRQTSLV